MNGIENLALRAATATDLEAVRELLERSDLPTGDLRTAQPQFVIALRGDRIIGAGALEHFGTAALLRSIAVEFECRGSGVGCRIVNELERLALAAGVTELVLLTLSARDFFARLGYEPRDRAQVPVAVLESAEFRSLCPASAVCMAKSLL
jgi:amino-acid N-acetyltransferase